MKVKAFENQTIIGTEKLMIMTQEIVSVSGRSSDMKDLGLSLTLSEPECTEV